jgi:hypothetical protein
MRNNGIGVGVIESSQPKGVKPKMRRCKLARGVKHVRRTPRATCTYFTRANHCSLFNAS